MSTDHKSSLLTVIQASLKRMEESLFSVCSDIESLKKEKQVVAQPLYIIGNTGMVCTCSIPVPRTMIMPVVGDDVDDKIIADLS